MKTENEIRLMLADYPDSLPSDEELMIAVFMGLQPLIVNEHHKIVGWYHDNPKNWFSFPEYKTWNSLMPVVEKINELEDNGAFERFDIDVIRSMREWILLVKINNVYGDIVTIIRWYNSKNS